MPGIGKISAGDYHRLIVQLADPVASAELIQQVLIRKYL
jgi:hypothetical protein